MTKGSPRNKKQRREEELMRQLQKRLDGNLQMKRSTKRLAPRAVKNDQHQGLLFNEIWEAKNEEKTKK